MVKVEIRDRDSFFAWLKTRPAADNSALAVRMSLRVFPLWAKRMERPWAIKASVSALPILRIFFAKLVLDDAEVQNVLPMLTKGSGSARGAYDAKAAYANADDSHAYASDAMAYEAAHSADSPAVDHDVIYAADLADGSQHTNWTAVFEDAVALAGGRDLRQRPLWPTPAPDWFTTADRETRAIWAKDPPTWAFWEKWWDRVISGDMPFPPDLLRDVALIEDDIWQAGPREVAAAIARIEKIHDLRAQLAALTQAMEDEDLSHVRRGATLAHRGHNNPPEMIEAIAIVQASAVDIAQALDEAREELAKPAPEASRLKAIGTSMLSVLKNAAGYCGVLADKYLQELAGEMGKQSAKWFMILAGSWQLLPMLEAFARNMIAIWPF